MTDRYVDTAVARFRYAMIGSGTPVLLLPGSGGWRLTFHSMAAVLAERHTVFALDPPGQGLTEVLDPDFGNDADAIARSIAVFLDAVGLERTAIVGHSWGGGFALRFAQLYPERVTRLALLGPAGLDVKDVWSACSGCRSWVSSRSGCSPWQWCVTCCGSHSCIESGLPSSSSFRSYGR